MQQILDKTWKIGQSFDPSVGFKGQFQYSKNLDVSNIKNGITLSSLWEEKTLTTDVTYCSYAYNKLVKFYLDTPFTIKYSSNTDWPATDYTIGVATANVYKAIAFQGLVYGFGIGYACTVVPNVGGAITDITAGITWTDPDTSTVYTYSNANVVMNYANSLLLVADGNKLWRYCPVASPGLPIGWKVIRNFETGTKIIGLTKEGNYLKIWVVDSYKQTKVHYATGTFDVEYSGLVQTIELDSMVGLTVESDQTYDYLLCRNSVTPLQESQYSLFRLQGVNKTLIKRTLKPNGPNRTDFKSPSSNIQNMQIKKGVLYVQAMDGIRTFRNESVSSGLSTGNISAPVLSWASPTTARYTPISSIIFGDYIYVCYNHVVGSTITKKEVRVEIEYRPKSYQTSGELIGMVNDGGIMGLDKTNIQLNLGYLLPKPTLDGQGYPTIDPGKINIYLRYDREYLDLTSGRKLIKTIDDWSKIRERVLLTTDNDFCRDWNTVEYKIELIRSTTTPGISPIFNEYNHLYDFTNRLDVIGNYKSYPPPTT